MASLLWSSIDLFLFSEAEWACPRHYRSSTQSSSFQFAGSNTVFYRQGCSTFLLQYIVDNGLPRQQIRHFALSLEVPSGIVMQKLLTPNSASLFTNLVWNQSTQRVSWKSYETSYCVSLQLHSSGFYRLTRSHCTLIRSWSLEGGLHIMSLNCVNSSSTDYPAELPNHWFGA